MSDLQSVKEEQNQDEVKEILSSLGVSTLTSYVGDEKIKRLYAMGINISTDILAEILIYESGINIFRKKQLREDLLKTLTEDKIRTIYGDSFSLKMTHKINNFTWGNNNNSKKFLSLLGLDFDFNFKEGHSSLPSDFHVSSARYLYPYQNWLRKSINDFLFCRQEGRVIVHMPTGSGKTTTMLESACDFFRSNKDSSFAIIWFAHSEELCEQAVETFKELWGKYCSQEARVIRLWGGRDPDNTEINCPTFVVTSFKTAFSIITTAKNDKYIWFNSLRARCKLLIVDEAHQSTAPTYKKAIELFCNSKTKIIGLTATPGRHHIGGDIDSTKELSEFFNNNKINIVNDDGVEVEEPIDYLTSKGILSIANHMLLNNKAEYKLSPKELKSIETLMEIPSTLLTHLGEDSARSLLIAGAALKLSQEEKRQTIIFCPSKDNAIELAVLLNARGCKAAAVTGETDTINRRNIIRDFKQGDLSVLTNFGVLTTGFDAPSIRAVIIARPTLSVVLYSQMIGRGLRGVAMGGTSECKIVDVRDNIINMPNNDSSFNFFNNFFN